MKRPVRIVAVTLLLQLIILCVVDQQLACGSPPASHATAKIRQGPEILKPSDHGVGRFIPDVTFNDLAGERHKLSDFSNRKALVVALTGTGCPLCQKYAPTLAELERRYRERSVVFLFVNPNESETVDEVKRAVETHKFQGSYVRDASKELCRALGARTTTEVFVLDAARTLVYRGAVDDQYGFAYALNQPRHTYLDDALDAVLTSRRPDVAVTSSPGCELFYTENSISPQQTPVTYHNRVSRIIQNNCLECHRDGGPAPFALASYEEVKDYAGMIRGVVQRGIMPPWFAASPASRNKGDEHRPLWANDRSLSTADRADLVAWIEANVPEGESADAPLPGKFAEGWLIGEPDAVFEFPQPIKVKATGILPYKYIVVETNFEEDRWVQAIQVVPGDASVVHHVLVFVLPSRDAKERHANPRRRGDGVNYWALYVPGNSTQVYPEGCCRLLPKGSRLRFQMHYTTNGSETEDSTKIGMVFADEPPRHEVKTGSILDTRFRIPPGADNHQVEASMTLPADIQILGYLPHHHLRGKATRYELVSPLGESEVLLDIPRYDFNWQLFYQYAEPRIVQRGNTIRFTAWYDNSAENPANPDPTMTVRWGEQTHDEMHLGYVEYVIPGAKPGETADQD